jgi:hypothetical protein
MLLCLSVESALVFGLEMNLHCGRQVFLLSLSSEQHSVISCKAPVILSYLYTNLFAKLTPFT